MQRDRERNRNLWSNSGQVCLVFLKNASRFYLSQDQSEIRATPLVIPQPKANQVYTPPSAREPVCSVVFYIIDLFLLKIG